MSDPKMTDAELIRQLAKQTLADYFAQAPSPTPEYVTRLSTSEEERDELVSTMGIEVASMFEDALLEELHSHLGIE